MKTIQCQDCGTPVTYSPVVWGGKELFTIRLCEPCGVEQRAIREQAEKQRAAKQADELWATICPPRYADTEPSRLPQRQLAEVLAWRYQPTGLLLYGETNTGKTRSIWLLLRSLFDLGYRMTCLTSGSFSRQSSDFGGSGKSEEWADGLIRVPILFIDDIGKGRLTERNEADLFDIIEQRLAHKRPLLLTTNMVGDSIKDRMDPDRGEPLIRRLRESCKPISFTKASCTETA
jgi:DNA replication protein DnaC